MPHTRFRRRIGTVAVAAGLLAAAMTGATASAAPATQVTVQRACSAPAAGYAACFAMVDSDAKGRPLSRSAAAAADLHPFLAADLQDAYDLPSDLLGARQTIAIVDAFDDPNAESDLAVYRKANGLPACDADFPCFKKVNQRGGTTPPPADAGWAAEISLDLDMASAVCPNCQLLLVEADDNSIENLGIAVDTAVELGADVVSNSYGALEWNTELADLAGHYDHPGVTIVASSGDSGFGAQMPAGLPTVVSVGGTSLYQDDSARGWGERSWRLAGSGCSAYVPKPAWQKDKLCSKRTIADVSAVADPSTPVAVYDTYGSAGGWLALGGTSAAAPLIAGVYALAGNATTVPVQYPYSHAKALNDVTSGPAGSCGGGYLCNAAPGYDGPTGLGTPHGIGAF